MHVELFTMLSFCLYKNVKRGGFFVQDYPKIILRRLDPKRYGISSAPTELQSSTTDFLLLLSVAAEFSLGLFSSTSLPGVLTSSFTAVLGHLCTGGRKWPRLLPFTRHVYGDEVTTAKGPKDAWCTALGTTPTLLQK